MGLKKLWITAAILFCLIMVFPQTQAAPKAMVYEMDVNASPAVQGRRLPIDLECVVGFGGACCYTVYAHDVEAEILLPENVTLISGKKTQVVTSSGQSSGTVAVLPGGGLTRLSQIWGVQAEEYGVYNVTVLVTGRNELGEQINETGSATITIKSGASISTPIIPRDPSTGDVITILAGVSSSDSNVESVTLFYSKNQENWVLLPMENTEGEMWMGTIPSQKSEGEVYYYMESLDNGGKTFTTETYSLEVRDTDKIGIIKVMVTYGTLAAFILGTGLILLIGRSGKIPPVRRGMMILGASLRLSALRGLDEIEDDQERLRKLRKWVALVILIVMIILLVLAIITGQLQDVITETTNPEGA